MADQTTKYKLYDHVEKKYLPSDYSSYQKANIYATKKELDYGSSRYSIHPATYIDGSWVGKKDIDKSDKGPTKEMREEALKRYEQIKASRGSGGGGSGGVSDTREMQAGADLDPKSMMKREGYKKGGTASSRGDGCAQRGKTKGRIV